MGEAEKKLKHKMEASFEKPKGFKKDYFVPNFGEQDVNIADTQAHIAQSETALGHVMEASFKTPKGHPKDYFVPNFGPQETDVTDTQTHIADTEKTLGHVLAASFKEPKGPKRDYFVPNFGLDHDILTAQSNIDQAQGKLGHVWSADNVDITANVQIGEIMRLENGPSIESPGCFCTGASCTDECEAPSKE